MWLFHHIDKISMQILKDMNKQKLPGEVTFVPLHWFIQKCGNHQDITVVCFVSSDHQQRGNFYRCGERHLALQVHTKEILIMYCMCMMINNQNIIKYVSENVNSWFSHNNELTMSRFHIHDCDWRDRMKQTRGHLFLWLVTNLLSNCCIITYLYVVY